eukprot:jgi/Galph1/4522/GphlegSOOS_G3158.1
MNPEKESNVSREERKSKERLEEEFVVLRLPQTTVMDSITADNFRLIGVGADRPFLQIGNQIFEGNIREPMGTFLLFVDNETNQASKADKRPSSWGYIGCADKIVEFRKAKLTRKKEISEEQGPLQQTGVSPMSEEAHKEVDNKEDGSLCS